MNKWLVVGIVSLFLGCSSSGGDKDGTQCCALKKFCAACSFCHSDERTISTGGDEAACKKVNDLYIGTGRFCSPSDGSIPITRYIAECANN